MFLLVFNIFRLPALPKENKAKEAAKEEANPNSSDTAFTLHETQLSRSQDDWLDSLMGRCMVSSSKDAAHSLAVCTWDHS